MPKIAAAVHAVRKYADVAREVVDFAAAASRLLPIPPLAVAIVDLVDAVIDAGDDEIARLFPSTPAAPSS